MIFIAVVVFSLSLGALSIYGAVRMYRLTKSMHGLDKDKGDE